jgi:ferredoxin-nitrite reductase/sulfite reductase (ferredoxin)
MIGGNCDHEGQARFGRPVARIPARKCPEAVQKIVDLYRQDKQGSESFRTFLARIEVPRVKDAVQPLTTLESHDKAPELYRDHGQEGDFKVHVGTGECAV